MTSDEAKALVLKECPDAWVRRADGLFFICDDDDIGVGFSEAAAWHSAWFALMACKNGSRLPSLPV